VAVVLVGVAVGPRAVAAIGGAVAGATPTPTPTARPTPEPLPACEVASVPAVYASYDDWGRTLLDTRYTVGASYVPPDLVPITQAGLTGTAQVRSIVIADLSTLVDAAKVDGVDVQVNSAYRSYADQDALYAQTVSKYGAEWARTSTAQAGHSEHQLGTAIDFGGSIGWWLNDNAWQYGFVGSFPADSSPAKTCYKAEAWHYRYVGRANAQLIHDSGLPLREWLWFNTLANR
jgi:D-alanyl-D-alanine carboxypeptidase